MGPGDCGREVLLLKDDKVEFTYIPQQRLGSVKYDFAVKKRLDGDLSGWLNLSASDYWDAIYSDFYWSRNTRDRKSSIVAVIESFFPGAKLIDLKMKEKGDAGIFNYKAYFVVNSGKTQETMALFANDGDYLFPSLSNVTRRLNSFHRLDDDSVKISYTLPESYSVGELPAIMNTDNDHFTINCKWQRIDGKYVASLRYKLKSRILPASIYNDLKNTVDSVSAWMKAPLIALRSKEPLSDNSVAEIGEQLSNFPKMPTAQGQLNLINERYPESGNLTLRKQALTQLISWFPKDKELIFEVKILIGYAAYKQKKYDDSLAVYKSALKVYKERVDKDYYSWGEYCRALSLDKLQRTSEAIAIFLRLGRNKELSDFRRGWSFYRLAEISDEKPLIIKYLKEGVQIGGPAYEDLFKFLINQLCRGKQSQEVTVQLQALMKRKKLQRIEIINELATYPEWYLDNDETAAAMLMNSSLLEFIGENEQYKKATKVLAEVKPKLSGVKEKESLYQLLKNIDNKDFTWWSSVKLKKEDSAEAYEESGDEFLENKNYRSFLKAYILAITQFPFDYKTFSRKLWIIPNTLADTELYTDLEKLLFFCKKIPKTDAYYRESCYVEIDYLKKQKKYKKAIQICDSLFYKPLSYDYHLVNLKKRGGLYEKLGQFEKALKDYEAILPLIRDDVQVSAWNILFRAICFNLQFGRDEAALKLIKQMVALPDETIEELEMPNYVNGFKALYQSGKSREYWQQSRRVYTKWQSLRVKFKVNLNSANDFMPMGNDENIQAMPADVSDITQYVNIYDRAFSLARWMPQQARITAYWTAKLATFYPAHKSEMYDVNIALTDCLEYIDENSFKDLIVARMVNLVDAEKNKELEKTAFLYYSKHSDSDEMS
ncbi:MAG: tetratricopeptide repeat protein, partial [Lentisphaeraceae bacterium]|nr:tetratricopeptide repeat protein [Lentisphaeraceae bacterium]